MFMQGFTEKQTFSALSTQQCLSVDLRDIVMCINFPNNLVIQVSVTILNLQINKLTQRSYVGFPSLQHQNNSIYSS